MHDMICFLSHGHGREHLSKCHLPVLGYALCVSGFCILYSVFELWMTCICTQDRFCNIASSQACHQEHRHYVHPHVQHHLKGDTGETKMPLILQRYLRPSDKIIAGEHWEEIFWRHKQKWWRLKDIAMDTKATHIFFLHKSLIKLIHLLTHVLLHVCMLIAFVGLWVGRNFSCSRSQ